MDTTAHIPAGNTLQGGKYRIVRFINAGGFGCTYEAEHVMLGRRVAIKEFFVEDFCNRDGATGQVSVATEGRRELVAKLRKKFIDEARTVSRMSHPNIVKVHDVFEENGTAYFVMDYIDGPSLESLVRDSKGLDERKVRKVLDDLISALDYVHGLNCLHLDIKPGNIMLTSDGRAMLIDFGASKQYDEVNGQNTSTLVGKTPGYAPLEQMDNSVQTFTPATDIYALGATVYKLLTGQTPPEASEVLNNGRPQLPAKVPSDLRAMVERAMAPCRNDRYQSIKEIKTGMGAAAPKPEAKPVNEATIMPDGKTVLPKPKPANNKTKIEFIPISLVKQLPQHGVWGLVVIAVYISIFLFSLPYMLGGTSSDSDFPYFILGWLAFTAIAAFSICKFIPKRYFQTSPAKLMPGVKYIQKDFKDLRANGGYPIVMSNNRYGMFSMGRREMIVPTDYDEITWAVPKMVIRARRGEICDFFDVKGRRITDVPPSYYN